MLYNWDHFDYTDYNHFMNSLRNYMSEEDSITFGYVTNDRLKATIELEVMAAEDEDPVFGLEHPIRELHLYVCTNDEEELKIAEISLADQIPRIDREAFVDLGYIRFCTLVEDTLDEFLETHKEDVEEAEMRSYRISSSRY